MSFLTSQEEGKKSLSGTACLALRLSGTAFLRREGSCGQAQFSRRRATNATLVNSHVPQLSLTERHRQAFAGYADYADYEGNGGYGGYGDYVRSVPSTRSSLACGNSRLPYPLMLTFSNTCIFVCRYEAEPPRTSETYLAQPRTSETYFAQPAALPAIEAHSPNPRRCGVRACVGGSVCVPRWLSGCCSPR